MCTLNIIWPTSLLAIVLILLTLLRLFFMPISKNVFDTFKKEGVTLLTDAGTGISGKVVAIDVNNRHAY